jgi:hypothetical protein
MKHYLSSDGGQTWADTTQVNPYNGVDKPWMVVNGNEIYIAWQQMAGQTGLWFAKSTDYGQSFNANQIWNRQYLNALGMDENENLHLLLVANGGGVYYRKSTDHGDTWLPEVNVGSWFYYSSYGDRAPINSVTARGDVVFGTWVDNGAGNWDIKGVRSTDGGDTWGTPFIVNDITSGGQCKGWAHFDVYGGLHVIYYHTPDWPTSTSSLFELRYQYSPDSGASFNPSIRVSDTNFTSLADFMGEYHVCVSDSQYLYAIWTDGRNGDDNDLYFSRAPLTALSVHEGAPVSITPQRLMHVPTVWYGAVSMEIEPSINPVEIRVYDITGRQVGTLCDCAVPSGLTKRFSSADFPKGIIFIRAKSQYRSEVLKIVNLGTR